MSNKRHPRLGKFFGKLKTLLVAGLQPRVENRPEMVRTSGHVQMELDLGWKIRE